MRLLFHCIKKGKTQSEMNSEVVTMYFLKKDPREMGSVGAK